MPLKELRSLVFTKELSGCVLRSETETVFIIWSLLVFLSIETSWKRIHCRLFLSRTSYESIFPPVMYPVLLASDLPCLVLSFSRYNSNHTLGSVSSSDTDKWTEMPAFGTALEEHLKRSNREIALPMEACIMMLLETGMHEEVFDKNRDSVHAWKENQCTLLLNTEWRVVAILKKAELREWKKDLLSTTKRFGVLDERMALVSHKYSECSLLSYSQSPVLCTVFLGCSQKSNYKRL